MQGMGERTAVSWRGSANRSGRRVLDGLSWAGIGAAGAAFAAVVLAGAPGVTVTAVAVLGALTVGLALRAPEAAPTSERAVAGPERLHSEVERARRLEYSFALVQLVRSDTVGGPAEVAAAEHRIRSQLRTTDVLIDHGRELYLLLPTSETRDAELIWHRITEVLPGETALWAQRSVAMFPRDGVTGDGLLEACRRGTCREADGRGSEVTPLRVASAEVEHTPDLVSLDGGAEAVG
jgi:hypothetical protein